MLWASIHKFPEYEVSNTGIIRSLDRTIKQTGRHGIKLNNDSDNLEWVTRQENIDHSIDTGLKPIQELGVKASACKGIVQFEDLVGNILGEFAGETACRAAGFTPAGVSSVMTGRQKTHRGYKFNYKEAQIEQ